MSTGALVVDALRDAENATTAKPTALLLASSPRAETWRYVFGSTTIPIMALMPRQTILPGIGPAFVLDVDISRLDAGQIERAAETISKRFDVPIEEVRQGILGEHGLPILCDELAATTLRFCDGCNADLGALAPHASTCEYQRPSLPPEPASATPAWNVCPTCHELADISDEPMPGSFVDCSWCDDDTWRLFLASDVDDDEEDSDGEPSAVFFTSFPFDKGEG
jgi:hypothetical protein